MLRHNERPERPSVISELLTQRAMPTRALAGRGRPARFVSRCTTPFSRHTRSNRTSTGSGLLNRPIRPPLEPDAQWRLTSKIFSPFLVHPPLATALQAPARGQRSSRRKPLLRNRKRHWTAPGCRRPRRTFNPRVRGSSPRRPTVYRRLRAMMIDDHEAGGQDLSSIWRQKPILCLQANRSSRPSGRESSCYATSKLELQQARRRERPTTLRDA